jgi:hypothetical protein
VGVFALVTAIFSWQLWLLPSLLFKGIRLAQNPTVTDWTDEPPPDQANAWIDAQVEALEAQGFVAGRRTRIVGELATSVVWRAHLRHKKNRTRAALSAWFLAVDDALKPVRQELTLQVEAGSQGILLLTTGDDVDDALWPADITTLVLPDEQDIGVILACFQRRLAELGENLARAHKNRRDGPAEVVWRRQELFDHQVVLGLLRLDEDASEWRLTWTGACMNGFYQFWPLRRRAVRRQRREAARLRKA